MRAESRTIVWWQIAIVLGLSLGRSAIYSLVDLAEKLTTAPLSEQSTVLNQPLASTPVFDAIRQLLGIGFGVMPVVLALFLVLIYGRNPFKEFGFDFRQPGKDLAWGSGFFLFIGAGTVAVYLAGRAAGITTQIVGSGMNEHWWTPVILTLSAFRHGLVEEIIIVAWLVDRLRYLGFSPWSMVLISSVIRGTYHLYQGLGPGIGNLLMGIILCTFYLRYRRVMPLIITHAFLDIAGFVGYPLLAKAGWLG